MRPVIGITKPDRGNNLAYAAIFTAVWLCGGRPRMITPRSTKKASAPDALILGGGQDVFPALFQDEPAPKENYIYDHDRDEMELFWLRHAENNGLPVLGICRGAQMMNVAAGGSLHMDIREIYKNRHTPDGVWGYMTHREAINIMPGTRLHNILGRNRLRVNAIHKQAIDKLGPPLITSAAEDNGIVQAIEKPGELFYIGVQFHPEFLIHKRIFRALFKTLITEARTQKSARL